MLHRGISVLWPGSVRRPSLSHGGVGGQDNAFNQRPGLLPLLVLGSREVQVTYCCLPCSSSALWKKRAFGFGSKSRCLARKFVLCLYCTLLTAMPASGPWVSYQHWVPGNRNITFTVNHFLSYWFSNTWKSLHSFTVTVPDEHGQLFTSARTLPGLPTRSFLGESTCGRMAHGKCLGP